MEVVSVRVSFPAAPEARGAPAREPERRATGFGISSACFLLLSAGRAGRNFGPLDTRLNEGAPHGKEGH
jgi:hypothetical protein